MIRQRYGRLQPRERSGRHRPDQSGHTGSGPAGQHDAGSAGNHRTAEKDRCRCPEQGPDRAARPDGHRQQPADSGTEHLELVQQLRVGVWTVN